MWGPIGKNSNNPHLAGGEFQNANANPKRHKFYRKEQQTQKSKSPIKLGVETPISTQNPRPATSPHAHLRAQRFPSNLLGPHTNGYSLATPQVQPTSLASFGQNNCDFQFQQFQIQSASPNTTMSQRTPFLTAKFFGGTNHFLKLHQHRPQTVFKRKIACALPFSQTKNRRYGKSQKRMQHASPEAQRNAV